MDQYLSTIIVAAITGIVSIISLLITKKQDKVINKIDEQTTFIERERVLKQKMSENENKRNFMINAIMILILDTNLNILRSTQAVDAIDESVFRESEKLKNDFKAAQEEYEDLRKEHQIVLDMVSQFQKEIEKVRSAKK